MPIDISVGTLSFFTETEGIETSVGTLSFFTETEGIETSVGTLSFFTETEGIETSVGTLSFLASPEPPTFVFEASIAPLIVFGTNIEGLVFDLTQYQPPFVPIDFNFTGAYTAPTATNFNFGEAITPEPLVRRRTMTFVP